MGRFSRIIAHLFSADAVEEPVSAIVDRSALADFVRLLRESEVDDFILSEVIDEPPRG